MRKTVMLARLKITLAIGVFSLCLMSLSACSQAPAQLRECPSPPALLLMETPLPESPVLERNLDLVLHILDLRERLEACNADKTALRDWHTQMNGGAK